VRGVDEDGVMGGSGGLGERGPAGLHKNRNVVERAFNKLKN